LAHCFSLRLPAMFAVLLNFGELLELSHGVYRRQNNSFRRFFCEKVF